MKTGSGREWRNCKIDLISTVLKSELGGVWKRQRVGKRDH